MTNSKWISGSVMAMAMALIGPTASAHADDAEVGMSEAALPAAEETAKQAEASTAAASLKMWQKRLAAYKKMGGHAYKTGLVERAERQVARYQREVMMEAGAQTPRTPTSPEALVHEQKAERYRQLAGAGYKTGLVQKAEADARRHGSQVGVTESNVALDDASPSSGKTVEMLLRRSGS